MLTPSQRKKNIESLKTEHSRLLKLEKEKSFANRPPCPFCGQKHIYAYGSNPGNNKRFKCAACKKTFTKRSGTCFHYIHLRSKFQKYMEQMLSEGHKSLKKLAIEHNICILTAFDWRHKILASIGTSENQLQGLIELRNSIFTFSRKGIHLSKNASKTTLNAKHPVQLIIAADYNKNSVIKIAKIGKLQLFDLDKNLENKFDSNSVIISYKNKALSEFSSKHNLTLNQINKKSNPLKKANEIDRNLRLLVYEKARGVSTKYLHFYARWVLNSLYSQAKKSNLAWPEYTKLEDSYSLFQQSHSEIPHLKTAHREWKTASLFD